MTNMSIYNIYTDGSATKEQSGFGFVVVDMNNTIVHMVSQILPPSVTNQQAELLGAIMGYRWIKSNIENAFQINIYSDSAYLVNCYIQQWHKKWISNGWINSKGKDVANKQLWLELLPAFNDETVNFLKIAGHSGKIYNELADALATHRLDKVKKIYYNIEREKELNE